MTKQSFVDATKGMMNSIRQWDGHKIACVGWHSDPWKLVDTYDFDTVTRDEYVPLAVFHTREDLWNYLKTI